MPLFQKARFKSPFIMQGELKEFACFFYMTEGSMHSFDARGSHSIGSKEALLKQCGNYVQRYISDNDSKECEAIAVYLYPELLKEIYRNEVPYFLKEAHNDVQPKKLIHNKLIEQYMANLSHYFEAPETLDEELGILKLRELMRILLKSEQHQDIRLLLSEIFAPVNVKFKESIQHNLFNDLSLDQLAFICNMSLSTFKREFKKTFGTSPARYIKDQRLQHAATLLCCNNSPIASVAYDSGFKDVTTFSAIFKEKYRTSPTLFRLNQKRK